MTRDQDQSKLVGRHCGLVVSAPAWDGTGPEFDPWQCRIIYPMFIESTITWVLGTSGYIWLDTESVFKKTCVANTVADLFETSFQSQALASEGR